MKCWDWIGHIGSVSGRGSWYVRGGDNEDGEENAGVVHLHLDARVRGGGAVRGSGGVSRLAAFFLPFFFAAFGSFFLRSSCSSLALLSQPDKHAAPLGAARSKAPSVRHWAWIPRCFSTSALLPHCIGASASSCIHPVVAGIAVSVPVHLPENPNGFLAGEAFLWPAYERKASLRHRSNARLSIVSKRFPHHSLCKTGE